MDEKELARLERENEMLRAIEVMRQSGSVGSRVADMYAATLEIQDMLKPIRVDVAAPPAVVIPPAEVRVDVPAAQVRVDVPDQSGAIFALAAAMDELVSLFRGHLMREQEERPKRVTFDRDSQGRIAGATVVEA